MSHAPAAFKTPKGEATYLAVYDAALTTWPLPYEERWVTSRYGLTHVVVSGPEDAPPLVLLHGFWATLTMWTPNIRDLAMDYRVYAVDVMGQPGGSVPDQTIRTRADHVAWLSSTLDGLDLDHAAIAGMSYGGWLALNYAIAMPERVDSLVLLSPAASFMPLVPQFGLRGMLMVFLPSRFTVSSFMNWLSFSDNPGDAESQSVGKRITELMYLGVKHFRVPSEGAVPTVFTDSELRSIPVPTLVMIGEHEVIYDPDAALGRARRLIPHCEWRLIPRCGHDMTFTQHELVDHRILDFLNGTIGRPAALLR